MAAKAKQGLFYTLVGASEAALENAKQVMAENTLRRRGQSAEQDAANDVIDAKEQRIKILEGFAKDAKKTAETFNWTEMARLNHRIGQLTELRSGIRAAYVEMFGDEVGLTDLSITDIEVKYSE